MISFEENVVLVSRNTVFCLGHHCVACIVIHTIRIERHEICTFLRSCHAVHNTAIVPHHGAAATIHGVHLRLCSHSCVRVPCASKYNEGANCDVVVIALDIVLSQDTIRDDVVRTCVDGASACAVTGCTKTVVLPLEPE